MHKCVYVCVGVYSMGLSAPGPPGTGESDIAIQKRIQICKCARICTYIRKYMYISIHICRCLRLGTGESGKSTIFKQLQLIYGAGFSANEKKTFTTVVRRYTGCLCTDRIDTEHSVSTDGRMKSHHVSLHIALDMPFSLCVSLSTRIHPILPSAETSWKPSS